MTTWKDLEGILIKKSDWKRQIPCDFTHVESRRKQQQQNKKQNEAHKHRADWLPEGRAPGYGLIGEEEWERVFQLQNE